MSKTPEYAIWSHMLSRSRGVSNPERYFDRGIRVCKKWLRFENFFKDMGRRPSPAHSIDRIDNDGWYSPTNCRWATASQQGRNTRSNRIINADGKRMTLVEWSEKVGIKQSTIRQRIDAYGWTDEKAVATNAGEYRKNSIYVTIGKVTLTISEWSRRSGLLTATIRKRLNSGMSPSDAISVPIDKRKSHPK